MHPSRGRNSRAGAQVAGGRRGTTAVREAVLALAILSTGLGGAAAGDGAQSPGAGAQPPDPGQVFDARRAEVVFPEGRVVSAEIADTPYRMQYGYMFRQRVGAGEGMIFVYPAAGFHSMWMKNTLVPLDMVWMDADFRVVHIERSVPPCRRDPCPAYGPLRRANYVLEVQGGSIGPDQLAPGDRVSVSFPRPGRRYAGDRQRSGDYGIGP